MNDVAPVSADEVKRRIQEAYTKALRSGSVWRRSSGIGYLTREVKLYGHDAGVDFVETHFGNILQEAVEEAGCKRSSLSLGAYGFGKAALAGMASKLRERTALKVETSGSIIKLIWAEPNPGLL